MQEKINLIKKLLLWLLGNAFVYHVIFPLIYVAWVEAETPEEIPVDEQEN